MHTHTYCPFLAPVPKFVQHPLKAQFVSYLISPCSLDSIPPNPKLCVSPIQLPTNNHLSDVVEGGRDDVEHGMYGCFQENDMEEGDCNIYSIRRKWGKNLP